MGMKLHLNSGNEINIELVNSPLIRRWAIRFCKHSLDETEVMTFAGRPSTFNRDRFDVVFNELLAGIRKYNGPTFKINDYNNHIAIQQLLNVMHHWCVELVKSKHNNQNYKEYQQDVINIGKLNALCHECEGLLTHGIRAMPERCNNIYWDQSIQSYTNHTIQLTPEWIRLMTNKKYDVYIAKRILGKDYREAYRDYDDPTYNEMQSFGDRVPLAFEFDPLNYWNDLYELPEFIDYMPADKNNNRIPLGNISNEVDNIDYILRHDKIDKVTYNESI